MRYLTKYLSSLPIGLSRIVRYYYQSHKTKLKTYEIVDAKVFVGRLVQHIPPKEFQRVRYCGFQTIRS
ncbi:transposase [Candidatus Enterovibrio escicola]|uniref:transposase n=1 Tax=Candidatus Enterovibrio escicola TaxID=1927127 RepID=UPI000BE3BC96